MPSNNPIGGDNQQETESPGPGLNSNWVCGFVDGEGCFSVAFHANPYVRQTRGWQIYPSFHLAQHRDNRSVLQLLAQFFGVGDVRGKGEKSAVDVYSVFGVGRLMESIVPFFYRHPLIVKADDFERFASVCEALSRKEHLSSSGFERVVRIAYSMNCNGKQRSRTIEEILSGSSETVREAPGIYVAS